MNDQPSRGIRVSEQRAWEFLQTLASDETYRARLESGDIQDAVDALAEFDIEVSPEILPRRIVLPPVDLIQERMQTIAEEDLNAQVRLIFQIICFIWPWFR